MVLLAAEILKECKEFIEDGLHPRIIIRGIREVNCRDLVISFLFVWMYACMFVFMYEYVLYELILAQ